MSLTKLRYFYRISVQKNSFFHFSFFHMKPETSNTLLYCLDSILLKPPKLWFDYRNLKLAKMSPKFQMNKNREIIRSSRPLCRFFSNHNTCSLMITHKLLSHITLLFRKFQWDTNYRSSRSTIFSRNLFKYWNEL
jgi:hypothetical protein